MFYKTQTLNCLKKRVQKKYHNKLQSFFRNLFNLNLSLLVGSEIVFNLIFKMFNEINSTRALEPRSAITLYLNNIWPHSRPVYHGNKNTRGIGNVKNSLRSVICKFSDDIIDRQSRLHQWMPLSNGFPGSCHHTVPVMQTNACLGIRSYNCLANGSGLRPPPISLVCIKHAN